MGAVRGLAVALALIVPLWGYSGFASAKAFFAGEFEAELCLKNPTKDVLVKHDHRAKGGGSSAPKASYMVASERDGGSHIWVHYVRATGMQHNRRCFTRRVVGGLTTPFPSGFANKSGTGNRYIPGWALSVVNYFHCERQWLPGHNKTGNELKPEISPYLGFADTPRLFDRIIGRSHGISSRSERFSEKPNSPRAQKEGGKTSARHYPLSRRVTVPPDLIAISRTFGAIFGGAAIMFGAGWFSWRDPRNLYRFYGGLFGGLFLSGLWIYFLFGRLILSM